MGIGMDLVEYLRKMRLVPVAEVGSAFDAVPLARALCDGGLPLVEVTFRTPAAADAIKAIATEVPDMVVGAGTVRSFEQAERALEAGASFLVAPGLNQEVIARASALGLPILPGVCTPTEIEQALAMGLRLLKFFPAEAAGGVSYLKALAGPYRDVMFVPTGGIGVSNLASYLELANVVACGGSWMVSPSLISSGDFAAITALTAEALALIEAPNGVSA